MRIISLFELNFECWQRFFSQRFRFLTIFRVLAKNSIFIGISIFDQIFRVLAKISIFDQNLEISIFDKYFEFWQRFFLPRFWFLTNILSFCKNFDFYIDLDFWQRFRFLTKIWNFEKYLYFWQIFRFLTKTSIFDNDFDFWQIIWFLTNNLIFDKDLDFWQIFRIFDNDFDFWQRFRFSTKIFDKFKL